MVARLGAGEGGGGVEVIAGHALVPAAAVAVGPGGPGVQALRGQDVRRALGVGGGTAQGKSVIAEAAREN